jgi:hypothetical protein
VSDPVPSEGAGLKRGDRVLVRYGRFAGRVGEVEDVFRQADAGRKNDVVWVRFGDRVVEGFDPQNLIKKEDKRGEDLEAARSPALQTMPQGA